MCSRGVTRKFTMDAKCAYLLLLLMTGFTCAYKQCPMPGGNAGECRPLKQCKPLAELNKKRVKTEADLLYIKESTCGVTSSFQVLICCPPEPLWDSFKDFKPVMFNEIVVYDTDIREKDNDISDKILETKVDTINQTALPPPTGIIDFLNFIDVSQSPGDDQNRLASMCGKYDDSADKIIGGSYAEYNEYPWLVLLEYDNNATLCGGSLITPRYVLTAAHCIKRAVEPKFARLSEYNTTTFPTDYVEVNGGGYVNLTVKRIPIEKNIAHPNYTRVYVHHDIGLSKLSRDAKLGDFIRLICLPSQDFMKSFTVGMNFTVAGWGSDGVKPSDVKKYVRVPFVSMDTCKAVYAANRIMDSQMCAGGILNEDSCSGDSGGPLMYELDNTFVVVGVVSYGHSFCGTRDVPGVYTYVYSYLDWIRDNMD